MERRHPKVAVEVQRQTLRQMKSVLTAFRGRLDQELRPMGVTTAQMQMLHAVRENPGASGAQLARACRVTPQTAHAFLARAERDGWIVRGKDTENDRLVTRSPTAAGLELLGRAEELVRGMEAQVWRGTSTEEFAALNRILDRCLRQMEE